MTKREFLTELKNGLSGLPDSDVDERVSFYGEMIDDLIEEGYTEEEAVDEIGPVNKVIRQIVAETPLYRLVKERIKPKRALKAWEIVLIVLGFPLWFPLLVAAGAIVLSLYIVILSLIVSLWAIELSFCVSAPCGLIVSVIYFVHGYALTSFAMFGICLFVAGIAILAFYGCIAASKGILILTKKAFVGLKYLFIGKEKA